MSYIKLMHRAVAIPLLIGACSSSSALQIRVDDKELLTVPVIRGSRVYVPITAFRKMGLFVNWKTRNSSGTVAWPEPDLIYDITAGQSWVPGQIAGSKADLPGTPFMSGGQLMVPLRTPVIDNPKYRDFQIEWDSKNRIAIVRRSKEWLGERLTNDAALKTASPECYETPM